MDKQFWQGKRVFITGHTGFKGGWLSLWLHQLGADVTGYALEPPSHPNLFELAQIDTYIHSIKGDTRDLVSIQQALLDSRADIVIHMAAQALVRESYQAPVETYATNVMGTVNLLEAVRNIDSVRAVVNVTSDKCYENTAISHSYREDDPMGGHDPYSSSKGCSELVTAAYRDSFLEQGGVAVASARAGNVIGGGDWGADRLVPDIMQAIMDTQPMILRNPDSIRPWQHVLEPLCGYLMLAERLYHGEKEFVGGWNFGSGSAAKMTVAEVTERLYQAWGNEADWQQDDSVNPHEAELLHLDSGKAQQQLGWRPRLSIETALEWIVEWYQDYANDFDMHEVTVAQINRYQELQ